MIQITTAYSFFKQDSEAVACLHQTLQKFAEANTDLRGLVLIGAEGLNFTVSASPKTITAWKALLAQTIPAPIADYKDSRTDRQPFPQFKLKIKDEIVTMGAPGLTPEIFDDSHLSPIDWHRALQDPNVLVLDTRNDYEYRVGKFKNAIEFGLDDFKHFPEELKNSGIAKDKKVLIYCTGGIRCEKAIVAMKDQGYYNVFQLKGGILKYIEEFPNQGFEGECFVFDYRVAVDQQLQASQQYRLCPHCGQPGKVKIDCVQCHTQSIVCEPCLEDGHNTCSKNCDHHKRMGHRSRKPHHQELEKRRFRF